jgi:hypothetical protein
MLSPKMLFQFVNPVFAAVKSTFAGGPAGRFDCAKDQVRQTGAAR